MPATKKPLARFTIPAKFSFAVAAGLMLATAAMGQEAEPTESIEPTFFSNARQITFEGNRAGEGYFNADGTLMVFQSERLKENPFYQMYLLDFETGDLEQFSPGVGKTSCGWIHPNNRTILFASTHEDPDAKKKQREKIERREAGKEKRYEWPFDEMFELYAHDRESKTNTRLTNAKGYDAEGSYSPDGKLIAFASNRNAYSRELTDREQKMFKIDAAYMMDIFIMNADGSNVQQLTDAAGYDGGPFFSPDGKSICWRRFSENGVKAEIMTMRIDGSQQRKITRMDKMSWAPFYHPSGKYIIFNTNKHGFGNFELYIVDTAGKSEPVRITDTDDFDGLASFTADGSKLTWTSKRTPNDTSQVFLADWNHQAALKALENSKSAKSATKADGNEKSIAESDADEAAFKVGSASAKKSDVDFKPADIVRHVKYLCRPELGGRMTGSPGERKAISYVAAYFDYLGLKPAGDNGGWFQKFAFPDGAKLGETNQLTLNVADETIDLKIDQDWRPLTFSGNVAVDPAEVVFAGYGIVAPEKDKYEEYDSYVHLDVKDKWVLVLRFVPEDVTAEARRHYQFYGNLRKKAFYARQRGAKGLIVASGPTSQVRSQLVALINDFSPSGSSIAAISVTDDIAEKMLAANGKQLKQLQTKLDSGDPVMGFDLKAKVAAKIEVEKITGTGRNVIGRLQAGDEPSDEVIIVGAHIDHLGTGKNSSSLAKEEEQATAIHFGADDNASGVAAMLEIAEYLASQRKKGKLKLTRDVIFAGWSGEELGLHGSQHFAKQFAGADSPADAKDDDKPKDSSHDFVIGLNADGELSLNGEPTDLEKLSQSLEFIGKQFPDFPITIEAAGSVKTGKVEEIKMLIRDTGAKTIFTKVMEPDAPSKRIVAALNMDMVGRLEDKLILQGISSSSVWPRLVESKNAVVGLPVTLSNETDLPTDASSFYRSGSPILSAFTGSHRDYHTPRDTPEKLNYRDAARIARLMGLITRSLATTEAAPDYIKQADKPKQAMRGGMRAYLGTVPSYGDDVVGVMLEDTTAGAPAAVAGVRGGDIIVSLAGAKIENIYDYTAIMDTLKIGKETTIKVRRGDKTVELKITPASRD